MYRARYFDHIEDSINFLAYRIERRGGLNLLDLHVHAENFYLHLFNLLFDLKFKNLNSVNQNAEAIDLIDLDNKCIVQVSATATKAKIESALAKDLSRYKGFSFRFISISKDAGDLQTKTFSNPHNLIFDASSDIYDIPTILRLIEPLEIDRLKLIFEFFRKELHYPDEPRSLESNLAAVIIILAQEDFNSKPTTLTALPFDIPDKISHNRLERAAVLIEDYKVHHARVDQLYKEFDKQGANKSMSILSNIRQLFLEASPDADQDTRFFLTINRVCEKTRQSATHIALPQEELELCVGILVVDAFIRCKIYKHPPVLSDATP